jgi:DNA-binding CsgD family transcriptional regulator
VFTELNPPPCPDIPPASLARWQRVVDIIARIMNVPAGLVMRTDPPDHSVLVASKGEGNPYGVGTSFVLNRKLSCHSVLKNRDELLVRDAYSDPEWCDNQDLGHGLSFYLGLPLIWPNGKLFGTICVLDKRDNTNAIHYRDLLSEFRQVIESDLALLVEMSQRKNLEQELQANLEDLERRVAQRTSELTQVNEGLRDEISSRRKAEAALLQRECELEEANTALRVLLDHLESARVEFEENILRQIKGLVLPHVAKLRHGNCNADASQHYLDIIDANLNRITSSLADRLVSAFENLTPTEIEIAQMVMDGKTTKEIASALSRETSTVDFHRNNIRKKLGITSRSRNLRTHLRSLQ